MYWNFCRELSIIQMRDALISIILLDGWDQYGFEFVLTGAFWDANEERTDIQTQEQNPGIRRAMGSDREASEGWKHSEFILCIWIETLVLYIKLNKEAGLLYPSEQDTELADLVRGLCRCVVWGLDPLWPRWLRRGKLWFALYAPTSSICVGPEEGLDIPKNATVILVFIWRLKYIQALAMEFI